MALAELALTVGGMALNISVIGTLLDEDAAIPYSQSVPYVLTLALLFTLPYLALGMWLPAASTAIGAVLWTLVVMYRST